MITRGNALQCCGKCLALFGNIISAVGDTISSVEEIISTVGDTISTVENIQYCGRKLKILKVLLPQCWLFVSPLLNILHVVTEQSLPRVIMTSKTQKKILIYC